ncbi:hypothetical protein COB57_01350 [Candidatus Peregrinibacteria bacterium]|nr:MAG: hypothetical protein COB57_01350 [Candidatus Peregrinibacteria bacterium]
MSQTEFLRQLKAYGLENDIPNISENNAKIIRGFLRKKQSKKVLEIGMANAYSTIHFAEEIAEWDGEIYSFEISIPGFSQAQENIKKSGLKNIHTFHQNFLHSPVEKLAPFDTVFIDARKSEYKQYIIEIQKYITDDALIIIDDVIKWKHKMPDFYEYMEMQNIFSYEIIQTDPDDGIMVIWGKNTKLQETKVQK